MSLRHRLKSADSRGQASHLNAKSFLPTQKVAATNLPADRGGGGKLIKVISEERAFGLKRNSVGWIRIESSFHLGTVRGSRMYMERLNCGMKLKCLIYTPCLIDSDLCRALFGKEAGGSVEAKWDAESVWEREARPGGGQVIKRGQTDPKNRSADRVRLCRGQSGDNSSFALSKVRRGLGNKGLMTWRRNMTYLLEDGMGGQGERWDQRRQQEMKWEEERRVRIADEGHKCSHHWGHFVRILSAD